MLLVNNESSSAITPEQECGGGTPWPSMPYCRAVDPVVGKTQTRGEVARQGHGERIPCCLLPSIPACAIRRTLPAARAEAL